MFFRNWYKVRRRNTSRGLSKISNSCNNRFKKRLLRPEKSSKGEQLHKKIKKADSRSSGISTAVRVIARTTLPAGLQEWMLALTSVKAATSRLRGKVHLQANRATKERTATIRIATIAGKQGIVPRATTTSLISKTYQGRNHQQAWPPLQATVAFRERPRVTVTTYIRIVDRSPIGSCRAPWAAMWGSSKCNKNCQISELQLKGRTPLFITGSYQMCGLSSVA